MDKRDMDKLIDQYVDDWYTSVERKAFNEGYAYAKNNSTPDVTVNPYSSVERPELNQAWRDGYYEFYYE